MKARTFMRNRLFVCLGLAAATGAFTLAAHSQDAGSTPSITPKTMADALHMVMDSDRAVYTRRIVNRLASKEKVITASEHFEDCLLYTSPSPRDLSTSRMPSSA